MTHPRGTQLTENDKKLLALLVQGYSNKELVRSTGLAERTIKTMLCRIYKKLSVRGRTEAAVTAVRMGIGI